MNTTSDTSHDTPLAVALILSVGILMEILDTTIITAAIPEMATEFGVGPLNMKLAVTAYVLSLGILIPVSGWVADRFGARRVYLSAIGVFTLGSIMCGMANDMTWLIVSRIIQGAGGAMMGPLARLIMLRIFPREKLVAATAYMTTPLLLAPLLGPLIGGFFTTYLSWRWIFFINIPIGIIGIVTTLALIRDLPPQPRQPFDFLGFGMSATAIVLILAGFEGLDSPFMSAQTAVLLLAAGLGLGLYYWRYATRKTFPALDISLFGIRAFRTGVLFGGLSRLGIAASPFLLQLQFQVGFGYSALHAGSLVFSTAIGALMLKPILSTLLRLFGFKRLLTINTALAALATASLGLITPETPTWLVIVALIVFGFFRSTQFSTVATLTFADIPTDRQSKSVSLSSVALQITVALAVSTSASLIGFFAADPLQPSAGAMSQVFFVLAILPLVSTLGFMRLTEEDGAVTSGHRRNAAARSLDNN